MKVVAFNFATKEETDVSLEELLKGPDKNLFYWITIKPADKADARPILDVLGANESALDEFLGRPLEGRYDLYDDATHFSVAEAWFDEGKLKSGITEFLLGRHYLAVCEPDRSRMMNEIRRIYREDFQKFAKSSGFLIYEIASILLESSRRSFQYVTTAVEAIQLELFGKISDDIFMEVSRLTADILAFRRMVITSRDLFNDLATRKSAVISETTQPALLRIGERLERLGDDLDSERGVLNETLNLYMSMVSHRTNRVVNRLTIFSMLFLPLSFLCGLYGMNFEVMPELKWPYSYAVFWVICIIFVISFIVIIRKKKWI
ncbi:MAG: hypothetical protein JXR25_14965 [Pontiellaceae bacterium]|nr:hypothetical protein [Pontiellaceae bacterium]MBN2786120.1 hypothetical protein [Pontiellaceae bacterium]